MVRINPPTALLLLTDIVALRPGDWVIQNVANSAVGRLVIRLAAARGVRTMNVVRREALFAELKALGADACVVDGPDLAETVKAHTGGGPVRLGLDAVSGQATARLSTCLSEGGVVCNYGSMSGEDPVMARQRADRERADAGRLHPRPRPGHALAGADPGDLRRPRRADPQGRPVGAGREGLPDRGDQGGPGPRAARRAQR
jgi:NADPH:quinone reductase-like Zn-dependent oxidoreductase